MCWRFDFGFEFIFSLKSILLLCLLCLQLQQIECSAVQFRDTLLSETNLEEISDQIANSPVRDILDLRSSSNHVLVDTTGTGSISIFLRL